MKPGIHGPDRTVRIKNGPYILDKGLHEHDMRRLEQAKTKQVNIDLASFIIGRFCSTSNLIQPFPVQEAGQKSGTWKLKIIDYIAVNEDYETQREEKLNYPMLTLVSDIGGAAGLIAGVSMALVCGVLGDSHRCFISYIQNIHRLFRVGHINT